MKATIRRLLLFVPVLLALLFAGVYLLAGIWLESSGGRQAIEQELSRRLGVPVNLLGEFSIALLPSLGVAGTELVIGVPGPESELGRSEVYSVELALRPLLDGVLVIESFSLAGGRLYLERLPGDDGAAADSGSAPLRLPDIESFAIRDFEIIAGGDGRFLLQEFELKGFAGGRQAPFRLTVAGYGSLSGELGWNASAAELGASAAWSGYVPGVLQFRLTANLASASGDLQAGWSPPGAAADSAAAIRIALDYEFRPGGVALAEVRLDAGSQSAAGAGCVVLDDPPALHLDMASPRIDLDALPDLAALASFGDADAGEAGEQAEGAGTDTALAFNLRLRAAEARGGGAVAREAVLQVGSEPDCSGLVAVEPH